MCIQVFSLALKLIDVISICYSDFWLIIFYPSVLSPWKEVPWIDPLHCTSLCWLPVVSHPVDMNVGSFNVWQWVILQACPHRPEGNTTVGIKWEAWCAVIPTIVGRRMIAVSYWARWCSPKTLDLRRHMYLFIYFSSSPPHLFFRFILFCFIPIIFSRWIQWYISFCGVSNHNWHTYLHQPQQICISFVNIYLVFQLYQLPLAFKYITSNPK